MSSKINNWFRNKDREFLNQIEDVQKRGALLTRLRNRRAQYLLFAFLWVAIAFGGILLAGVITSFEIFTRGLGSDWREFYVPVVVLAMLGLYASVTWYIRLDTQIKLIQVYELLHSSSQDRAS